MSLETSTAVLAYQLAMVQRDEKKKLIEQYEKQMNLLRTRDESVHQFVLALEGLRSNIAVIERSMEEVCVELKKKGLDISDW